ncbi:MAG: hypothetical protein KCHDKBKB_02540 [Elusimicrobia bacterium]|nr:hypothetical protein [Elusimicrobiota bacterium]
MKQNLKIGIRFFCGLLLAAAVTSFTFHVIDHDHVKESHHACVVCKTITSTDGLGAAPSRFSPPHRQEERLRVAFPSVLNSLASYAVVSSRAPPLA